MSKQSIEAERRWRGLLNRFERSGLTIRAFCRQERLREQQFYAWRQRLRNRGGVLHSGPVAVRPVGPSGSKAPAFTPIHVVAAPSDAAASIEIILANGRRVAVKAGFEPATLTQVLQVMEGCPC